MGNITWKWILNIVLTDRAGSCIAVFVVVVGVGSGGGAGGDLVCVCVCF